MILGKGTSSIVFTELRRGRTFHVTGRARKASPLNDQLWLRYFLCRLNTCQTCKRLRSDFTAHYRSSSRTDGYNVEWCCWHVYFTTYWVSSWHEKLGVNRWWSWRSVLTPEGPNGIVLEGIEMGDRISSMFSIPNTNSSLVTQPRSQGLSKRLASYHAGAAVTKGITYRPCMAVNSRRRI